MNPAEAPRHRLLLLSVSLVALGAAVWWASQPHSCPAHSPVPRYQSVVVGEVSPTGSGYAVRLVQGEKGMTMYVGASEGLAIWLGTQGREYVRPLSMDLMSDALRQMDARLERVQIDSIRDGAFIGSLHLRQGSREIVLDARPSDAVALAQRLRAPILVADDVLERR